jgi:hypothetical protein
MPIMKATTTVPPTKVPSAWILCLLSLLLRSMDSHYCTAIRIPSFFIKQKHIHIPHKVSSNSSSSSSEQQHQHLERGIELAFPLRASDLYNAYRRVQNDYQQTAFNNTNHHEWKVLLRTKDGTEISILQQASDPTCPFVRIVAIIPVPPRTCWNFLSLEQWDANMPKMDPFYDSVHIHGTYKYNKHTTILLCRKQMKRILSFGRPRDVVFLSVTDEPLADGTLVSGSVSVRTQVLPPVADYTRAFQDSMAFYKPLLGGTQTELTIISRMDLNDASGSGGRIPMWAYIKTIGVTGALSISAMKDALVKLNTTETETAQETTSAWRWWWWFWRRR